MDGTISKTLTDKEKLIKEITYSSRFINLMMVLAIFKWIIIFGILSTMFFIAGNLDNYDLPVNIPFLNSEKGPGNTINLEESLKDTPFLENIFKEIWLYPIGILIIIVLPIVFLYYQFYLRISHRYAITDVRIIFKRGWLSTEAESIHYDRITDVLVTQTLFDKLIFGTGKIFINTAGGEDYEAELLNIADPYGLKKEIYSLKEKYLNRHAEKYLNPVAKEGV